MYLAKRATTSSPLSGVDLGGPVSLNSCYEINDVLLRPPCLFPVSVISLLPPCGRARVAEGRGARRPIGKRGRLGAAFFRR
jgi:hypothetical protein